MMLLRVTATALIAILTACAASRPAPQQEQPAGVPVARSAMKAPLAKSPAALARAYVEAVRAGDRQMLAGLVHPESLAHYRAKQKAEHPSYEEVWLTGRIPDGQLDAVASELRGRRSTRGGETSVRIGSLVFVYPIAPTHSLQLSIVTAEGVTMRVANHAIRAERGVWYIVLPSRTDIDAP